MVDTRTVGICARNGVYYRAERGMRLSNCVFEQHSRTVMLMIDLDDGIVYAGMGYSGVDDIGYVTHAMLADEIGISPGAEFDRYVRPVYRDGILSYNGVQCGIPVDTDMVGWDTEEFRCAVYGNVILASKLLIYAGVDSSMCTVYYSVMLPLRELAR